MRFALAAIPLLIVTSCAPAPSDSALCDGLADAVTAHAAALDNPLTPDAAIQTGASLIRGFDAGCE